VDGSWAMDAATVAALVDTLGGVSLDVDVQVLGGAGGLQVLLAPGRQKLTGAQALTFATYRGAGEQEQSRLARLQELLDGIVLALPTDQPQLVTTLGRLGAGSRVTGLDTQGLAHLLLGLRSDSKNETLQYDSLPVVTLETGAPEPSLRLDAKASQAVVDRLLAASVPPGVRQTGNRVKVFNGVGTPMLGSVVRDRLVAANLVYVPGGNAPAFGVPLTEIQVGDPTPDALALGRRVAKALGVPESAIRSSEPTSVADVIVVVGNDFPH
jgi:hypothetical protein